MTDSKFSVCSATPADAPALAALSNHVFRLTYGAAIPAATLDDFLNQHASPSALAADLEKPAVTYLVAWQERQLLGFSKLEVSTPPACITASNALELAKLYVDPRWHGCNVGAQLLQCSQVFAAERGHDLLWLCVWKENQRALRFYQKWGFETVGTVSVYVNDIHFDDAVMQKELKQGILPP